MFVVAGQGKHFPVEILFAEKFERGIEIDVGVGDGHDLTGETSVGIVDERREGGIAFVVDDLDPLPLKFVLPGIASSFDKQMDALDPGVGPIALKTRQQFPPADGIGAIPDGDQQVYKGLVSHQADSLRVTAASLLRPRRSTKRSLPSSMS